MALPEELKARFKAYDQLYSYDLRLQTFADWPFREECQCTPEMMARAGFVHCPSENEPDIACCFFCLRELEGWEPEDLPWEEHIKRSPTCGFLTTNKDLGELKVAQLYQLEKQRLKIYTRKVLERQIEGFREQKEKTERDLKALFDAMNKGK